MVVPKVSFIFEFEGLCYLCISNIGASIVNLIILCVCLRWRAICLYNLPSVG